MNPQLTQILELAEEARQMLELFGILRLEGANGVCREEVLLEGDQWWNHLTPFDALLADFKVVAVVAGGDVVINSLRLQLAVHVHGS
jgi:hypothetical protein